MAQTDIQFTKVLSRLNSRQKAAVEQIDGPLLVVAGPGTGKTQLLSARVAYILQSTDTLPNNILCLTFTESGAANMRERLTRFIGQAAYDVTIDTYHAFGGGLIRRFPQYFGDADYPAQSPIDGLGQREIVQAIVDGMAFKNPLKSSQHHLHDLMSTLSQVKKGLLSENDLRAIAQDNLAFLAEVNQEIKQIFVDFGRMPSKVDKALPYFENLYVYLSQRDQVDYTLGNTIKPLASIIQFELGRAIAEAAGAELDQSSAGSAGNYLANYSGNYSTKLSAKVSTKPSTKPLTAWKNSWLEKDADNNFIVAGLRENQRIEALADVLRQYTEALAGKGLYDFDDMILRSITALEDHQDLRFTLHEQYQYIMLDEFQDTNAAQLKLIKLLTNNPVHEGRPNVMAVGDDDQAIYAFQGAEVSNMLEFAQMYNGTKIINLTDNYRSHPEILHVAHEVARQIGTRLESSFEGMSKILAAANHDLPSDAHIDRHEFAADVGQYDWTAQRIAKLIETGVKASEIAVLAPRHKQLEPLVSFLNNLEIPVRYEKRENILEAPIVHQLLTISKLVIALHAEQSDRDTSDNTADNLWPEVLSYNFWQLSTSAIWQLSWKVRDDSKLTWSQALLAEESGDFRTAGLLILALAQRAGTEPLEIMLDHIIGNLDIVTGESDLPKVRSPLRAYYLGASAQTDAPDLFYQTLSHITVLREKLRDHQAAQKQTLSLSGLLHFVGLYEAADERMLNTSPYSQHTEAVQLMTVFKAKGLEFEHVFLPSCQDDVWGESSRSNSNRLTLPPNLAPIRPAGTTADERLRIFFVAVTRAKLGLHLTSFLQTYSGRATKRLKYLNEQEQGDGGFKTMILPAKRQDVRRVDHEAPDISRLELNWRQRHLYALPAGSESSGFNDSVLQELLHERLKDYHISPTHLTTFTDTIYGGPEKFFFNNMLCFPSAIGSDAQFGTTIHDTLQWLQQQVELHGRLPPIDMALAQFDIRLYQKKLPIQISAQLLDRGHIALTTYLKQRGHILRPGNKAEYNFRRENVRLPDNTGASNCDILLGGKIDLMEIDRDKKTITVVDYKTGKTFDRLIGDPKLHKYSRQLYCYKILIENSRTYKGYKVDIGRLEFVEPDDNGRIHSLEIPFSDKETEITSRLLAAMWRCVRTLQFPDISPYEATLTGIKKFETALLLED